MPFIQEISETEFGATATSHQLTLPASNIDPGDLILIYTATQEAADSGAPVTPAGYTQRFNLGHTSAFRPKVTSFFRIADGTEESDVLTFDWAPLNVETYMVAFVVKDVDSSNPFDVVTPSGPVGGTLDPDPPSITTITDGAMVIAIVAGNDGTGTTPAVTVPGDYVGNFSQVPDEKGFVIATKTVATAGLEDPGVFDWDLSGGNSTAITDAIRPAPAGLIMAVDLPVETDTADDVVVRGSGQATATVDLPTETDTANDVLTFSVDVDQAQFPDTTVDIRVELAFGANDNPLELEWTDVSDRILTQSTSIRRGRADESAQTQPSSIAFTLDNGDGALMPGNPNSPYYPHVRRGTPVRISVAGDEPALYIPGVKGAFISTPDHPDFSIPGPLDLRARVQPDQYAVGIDWFLGGTRLDTRPQNLITKWAEPNDAEFDWSIENAGSPVFTHTETGSQFAFIKTTSDQLVAALRPAWLGVTHEPLGDGLRQTHYRFDGDTPPADITEWDLVDEVEVDFPFGETGVIFDGAADLELGTRNGGEPSFRGRFLAAQIRDGINGTLVVDADFTSQQTGIRSFADTTGKTWTLNGQTEITTMRTRFVGRLDEIIPTWPWGDNNPTGTARPSEARVELTASGILRRLGQGAKPLRSALFRNIASDRHATDIVGYWPCEDAAGAGTLASGIAGDPPIVLEGAITAGSDSTLQASAPLPTIDAGETGSWRTTVNEGLFDDGWSVELIFKIPTTETFPTETQIIEIQTFGTVARWRFSVYDTAIRIVALNAAGAELVNSAANVGTEIFGDNYVQLIFNVFQQGPNIRWMWTSNNLGVGVGGGISDTIIGTVGRVVALSNQIVGPPDGFSFGHIVVHAGFLLSDWQAGADSAWVGESAAHRFWRLCVEENIPVEIVGDPTVFSSQFGDLSRSEPMGPQLQKTLPELLNECVRTDLGILISRRGAQGLVFRTRQTLEAQTPALQLSAQRNEITTPLVPRLDDQRLRNDITLTSAGGSSSRVSDPASIAAEGLYDVDETIIGVGGVAVQTEVLDAQPGLRKAVDTQNLQQASWRLRIGTINNLRIPTVTLDFRATPDLILPWHSVELGDRITLEGLPVQHPDETVELIVEAISEQLGPWTWSPVLTCSPGAPYLVGVVNNDNANPSLARLDTPGDVTLETAIDSAATELELATADWTVDPAHYPLLVRIGGETIRANGATTDLATVTLTSLDRAVNGAVKAHAAGAPVELVDPFFLSLGLAGHPTNTVLA